MSFRILICPKLESWGLSVRNGLHFSWFPPPPPPPTPSASLGPSPQCFTPICHYLTQDAGLSKAEMSLGLCPSPSSPGASGGFSS